jgi:hypothetical protein
MTPSSDVRSHRHRGGRLCQHPVRQTLWWSTFLAGGCSARVDGGPVRSSPQMIGAIARPGGALIGALHGAFTSSIPRRVRPLGSRPRRSMIPPFSVQRCEGRSGGSFWAGTSRAMDAPANRGCIGSIKTGDGDARATVSNGLAGRLTAGALLYRFADDVRAGIPFAVEEGRLARHCAAVRAADGLPDGCAMTPRAPGSRTGAGPGHALGCSPRSVLKTLSLPVSCDLLCIRGRAARPALSRRRWEMIRWPNRRRICFRADPGTVDWNWRVSLNNSHDIQITPLNSHAGGCRPNPGAVQSTCGN